MTTFSRSNENIIELNSQWVGDSLIRTVTRNFGRSYAKIVVDVTEFSAKSTSKQRGLNAAREAARRVGCVSVDCCSLRDNEIVRQSRDINTDKPVRTKVRSMTFAFDGLPE